MMERLEGIEFLRDNMIEEKECDLSKPFAFISYAHDDKDKEIVRNVFFKLYKKGYNLWIDTANIPKDENSWKKATQYALMNVEDTCKVALFFRSEESLVRKPIYEELQIIKDSEHIHRIITIDIWHDEGMTVGNFIKQMIQDKKIEEYSICSEICGIVNKDNSAYRLQDVEHDLDKLVEKLEKELERDGIKPDKSDKSISCQSNVHEVTGAELGKSVGEISVQLLATGGYTYTIFGKEYHAENREQGKLMYDVFAALIEKHPDKVDSLTARTSVARAEDIMNPNTKHAKPPYFRACKKFTVGTQDYYVGTSYGFEAKLAEIKGMLKLCGENKDMFCILGHSNEFGNVKGGKPDITQAAESGNDGGSDHIADVDIFQYTLWNEPHTADNLAKMMHDVFDLIAERYPERIEAMVQNNSISAVARKQDVDQSVLPPSKLNYFKAKKEHKVGERLYYVSTRYNREQGIEQLNRMLIICEGNSKALNITSMPQKIQKSVCNSDSSK